jgi:tRNA pseudouridine55 synthase
MMDGILIIDKPAGLTSHDVVARVRRILKERRVGHTGTLDPFATGVLVVLVGRATRLAQFLSGAVKEYEAIVRFGYATETGDLTGAKIETSNAQPEETSRVQMWSEREIETALLELRGEIEQVPPMYSAKKVQGQKLYELARRGLEVERAAVRVTIYELEAVKRSGALLWPNEDGTIDLSIRVLCSAGTYIRTLAEAIGERLGTRAHLAALKRTRAGEFRLADAISLEDLQAQAETSQAGGKAIDSLLPFDAALSGMPFVHLTADEAERSLHGMPLRLEQEAAGQWRAGEPVRMRDGKGRLIAVGFYDAGSHTLRPRVVFSPEK